MNGRRWVVVVGFAIVTVVLSSTRLAAFYTDVLWYRSLGFGSVFWGLLSARLGLGLVAGVAGGLLIGANLLLARRLAPTYRIPSAAEEGIERYRQLVLPYAGRITVAVAVGLGLLLGISAAQQWPTVLLWLNAQTFGEVDPQFGRDLGYFVFVLPFQVLANSWLFATLLLALAGTALASYVFGGIRPQAPARRVTPQANAHLSLLLAALIGVRAWGLRLDQFLLSYSQRGQVTGLSYTDVHAELPAYRLLVVIAVVCLLLFAANVRVRTWVLPAAGVGILLVATVVLAGIFPAVVQRVQVAPQELERERLYIERNLTSTRRAFDLDDVAMEPFAAAAELTPDEVTGNAPTLRSLRLWEPSTAQAAYEQLQALRPYYDILDVDADRYPVDGQTQQVLVAARELNQRALPSNTWQNRHLVYTHGLGLIASEVSTATADGQPLFLSRDIPPRGEDSLLVENPRLYFGEEPPDYSVVGTRQDELDFAQPQGPPQTFRYDGSDGVPVDSLTRRLAFALRLAEPNMVLSDLLTDESRVLFRRRVRDRVAAVAPFLKLDHDAYPVAVGDTVKWVQDAYTTSDMLPYSQRVDLGELTRAEQRLLVLTTGPNGAPVIQERRVPLPGIQGRANYIRNSVKAVVDAYHGTVELYVVDPEDPIIRAWQAAFPSAFTSGDDVDEELRAHFRYPEDMFRVQAEVFRTYHIPGPDEFYSQEDAWRIPDDPAYANSQLSVAAESRDSRPLRPTYQYLRLPGDDDPEYALLQTFTPRGEDRRNLIAYLAGRSEPGRYGELQAFLMPPSETVFGPEQVQARINQDEAISREVSLLNQRGSAVIYGNLLTIPIEDSLLYAQPLFLRAEASEIPVLAKVVLVFGDQIVMRDTLGEALQALFGVVPPEVLAPGERPPDDGDPPEDGETSATPPAVPGGPADAEVERLLGEALAAFAAADQALREGDLGRYQELTGEAQALLQQAQTRLSGAAPSATEPSAPAASATETPG